MTDERLVELEGLAGAATPGPWKATEGEMCKEYFQVIDVPTGCEIIDKENGGCASDPCPDDVFFSPENARFIAAARTAVPELLAEVRRLRGMYLDLLEVADRHVPIREMPDAADEARDWREPATAPLAPTDRCAPRSPA